MRYWQILVKSDNGRQFLTKAVEISTSRAVLCGDHALPTGAACNLQIVAPSFDKKQPAQVADLQAEVRGVVFAPSGIRLDLKIKSLSSEARQLIGSQSKPS
jgi:hypothetical protein